VLTVTSSTFNSNPGTGGVVWAVDFWPIVMPLLVRSDATSLEVYECDLDFAFGANQAVPPFITTDWGTSSGCISPSSNIGVVPGPSTSYENSLQDARSGQPAAATQLTGTTALVNGVHY
jgi:hypothetical protein